MYVMGVQGMEKWQRHFAFITRKKNSGFDIKTNYTNSLIIRQKHFSVLVWWH